MAEREMGGQGLGGVCADRVRPNAQLAVAKQDAELDGAIGAEMKLLKEAGVEETLVQTLRLTDTGESHPQSREALASRGKAYSVVVVRWQSGCGELPRQCAVVGPPVTSTLESQRDNGVDLVDSNDLAIVKAELGCVSNGGGLSCKACQLTCVGSVRSGPSSLCSEGSPGPCEQRGSRFQSPLQCAVALSSEEQHVDPDRVGARLAV
jgi:hypothetical protein